MSEVQIKAQRDLSIGGDVVGRDKITVNLPPPLPPAEAKDRANLLILLRKVKTFWIEGVLEKSVHNAVLLELGKETKPEAVDHPWGMVLELPDQTNQVLPPGTQIIDVFEKMNRAMLILGEPGSGKTITLLELARDLILRAEADPTQPIPVVFNLSSWTDERQSLHDWLVEELSTKYQIPKRVGRTWLKDNCILPLLDGLDEVRPEIRAICVEAINHFGETFGLPGRLVCCRLKEYTALTIRLKLNGAICLQPLTLDQVNRYLEASGGKLSTLRSSLEKDETLQELAKFPLMLSTMSLAYQEAPIEALTTQALEKVEDRRKHLFDTYILRMFKRKGKASQPYTIEQNIGWLSWLAQNMYQHNHTIFLIEELQPSWLSTHWQRMIYVFNSRIIGGLSWGLVAGLILGLSDLLLGGFSLQLIYALIGGVIGGIGGLSAGVIDTLRFARIGKVLEIRSSWQIVIYLLVYDLINGLLWGLASPLALLWGWASSWVLIPGLISGLLGALTFGLIFGVRGRNHTLSSDIQTVENLSWSWAHAKKSSIKGIIIGAIIGSIFFMTMVFPLESPIDSLLFIPLLFGLPGGGLLGGLMGLIGGGFKRSIVETKTLPNQGIKLSIRNVFKGGLIVAPIILPIMILYGLDQKQNFGWTLGLGLLILLLAFLWYGGLDVIQHYTLRFILCCKKYTPWNYARFLDHATNLIFLQKVGGGYIFMHRLLLEHFANMPLQSKTQIK